MEYQSFFMLLKEYAIIDKNFCSTNPLSARGYVMVRKESQKYFLVIQLENKARVAHVFCNAHHVVVSLSGRTTKVALDFEVDLSKLVVIIPDINLFATKSNTDNCQKAINDIRNDNKEKSIFQKMFGEDYNTYFYDTIKQKLSKLFDLGTSAPEFEVFGGKWVRIYHKNKEKIFGIVFKNHFAYAIAAGEENLGSLQKTAML